MNRLQSSLVAGIAILALSSVAASAQTAEAGADARPRLTLGPLGLTPRIELTNLGYDSNVLNSAASPEGDFTAALGPELDSTLRIGRLVVTGKSSAAWNYFEKSTTQRSLDFSQTGRADLSLVHLTPHLTADYTTSRQRPNFEIDARVRHHIGAIGAGASFAFGSRTSIDVTESRETVAYDDAAFSALLDRTTDGTSAALRFAMTPLTTLVVQGASMRDRFRVASDRNGDSTVVTGGLSFQPAALISGTASVGYKRFIPKNDALPAFRGIVAKADVKYTIQDATRVDVTVDRDLDYSFEEGAFFFVETGATVELTQALGAGWDVRGGLGRTRLAYPAIDTVLDGVAGAGAETDRVTTVTAGVGRRLGSNVRIGVDVTHAERRAPVAARAYKGYAVGGTVSYGF